jgi:hypothetical protein
MKEIHPGQQFDLALHESARLANSSFVVMNKSVMRLKPVKASDQFLLTLVLTEGKKTEEVSRDGKFDFPSSNVRLEWGSHVITVADIDFMARFISLIVDGD